MNEAKALLFQVITIDIDLQKIPTLCCLWFYQLSVLNAT